MDALQESPGSEEHSFMDRASDRLLRGPLAAFLALLCAAQFLAWVPVYLTWPWWADLDVFGTAALAWERGILPYRDFFGNNFPATMYVSWVVGKLFGWGYSPALLAFDATLVGCFGLVMSAWSRRVFGSLLPGLIGYGTFLGYYLALDYTQVAQRDWQGPFFAIAAILLIQAWQGRWAVVVSALCMAFAVAIRPQTVLYWPALVTALVDVTRNDEGRIAPGRAIGRGLVWTLVLLTGLAALAVPLIRAGVFSDFLRSLRIVAPGAKYNLLSMSHFSREMILQLTPIRILVVPACLLLLGRRGSPDDGPDPARAWLVAFACVLPYAPLSPQVHAYLAHPVNVTWTVLVALLVARIQQNGELRPTQKLIAVLLVMGLLTSLKPRFSDPAQSLDAVVSLAKGERESVFRPEGYQHNPLVRASARYEWYDYRDLLQYIRRVLPPDVRVANALKYVPAINGVTARLPVFPAESIAWLTVVRKSDEARFVQALENTPNSVVIWAPSEKYGRRIYEFGDLTNAIETLYEPDQRFGPIEVWKRKASSRRSSTTASRPTAVHASQP